MEQIHPTLELPSEKYKDSFLKGLKELRTASGDIPETLDIEKTHGDPEKDFFRYLKNLQDESKGVNLKPGRIPQTVYWIIDHDEYIGRISLRHRLNDNLLKIGGHIGYSIRPSKRKMGYGIAALKLVLPYAKKLHIENLLITCDATNVPSRKIIEHAGAIFENEVPMGSGKPNKLRFWIHL